MSKELYEALEYGLRYAKDGFSCLTSYPPIYTDKKFIELAETALSAYEAQAKTENELVDLIATEYSDTQYHGMLNPMKNSDYAKIAIRALRDCGALNVKGQ